MTQLAKQSRERVLLAEIFTVARRVLGHEDEFFDTFFGELMSFGDDRTKATTAEVAAHLRNETESAGTITTFSDLHERVVRWRREYAWRRFVVEISRALITYGHDRK